MWWRLCGLLAAFALSTMALLLAWAVAPNLVGGESRAERPSHFPQSFDELRKVTLFLNGYREEHFVYTVFLFSLAYLYKQTFAIPGSFFMNLLAGALFGRWFGCLVVCPLTAAGASLCFLLSASFARPVIEMFCKKKIRTLRDMVHENEHRLFYFLLCARFFPFTPHWLLNICSPFIDIRLGQFAASVFIGLLPYNCLCVHAGCALARLHSVSDVIDVWSILELLAVALAMGSIGVVAKKRNAPPVKRASFSPSAIVSR